MTMVLKKIEVFLYFVTLFSLLIVTTTTSEYSYERVSAVVESQLQKANKDNTEPICANIFLENDTEPALTLYQGEFDNIRVNILKNARFMVYQNGPKICRMQICGFSESKDNRGSCEYVHTNITAPDEKFGNDFEVTSVSCSCFFANDTCDLSGCVYKHKTNIWKTSECAALYQEPGCQSCYFLPITLQNNTNFNTSNSYQIHSAIVRPGCVLRQRHRGLLGRDNVPGERNFTNAADNYEPGYHKDSEDFYCLCPSEKIKLSNTTTSSPHRLYRLAVSSSTIPSTLKRDKEHSNSSNETKETTENTLTTTGLIYVIVVGIAVIVEFGLLIAILTRQFRKPKPCSKSASISIKDNRKVQAGDSGNIESCLSYIPDEIQKLFVPSDQLKTNSQSIISNQIECPQTSSKFEHLRNQFAKACHPEQIIPRNAFAIIDLENLLGSGEFGIVYKGLLRKNEGNIFELVAVKKITWKGVHDTVVESFIRELNNFQSVGIGHKHIVGFMGACCHSEGLYLLTEYCDGGSLRQTLLSEYRPKYQQHETETYSINIPDATKNLEGSRYLVIGTMEQKILDHDDLYQLLLWCKQIASGMEFLSSKRIIHVDLAARNILLTREKTVKICDLGLSRKCLGDASGANSYIVGQFPFHSYAPELISDVKNGPVQVTLHVDIWAYGCTLWELFTLGSSLYPTAAEEGIEKIIKIRELILEGYRHPKPELAPEYVFDKILECWNEIPHNRPSFRNLLDFFRNKCKQFK